jgi:CBS domain-containing protein
MIAPGDDLRSALSRLLAGGVEALAVVDADGRLLGRLTLADIRAVAERQQPAALEA